MRDFSLDLNSEKIYSPKTREYFKEVIKSYYNESYRSAIVMLYSIVIADLVYKIADLKGLYNDDIAKDILKEIEEMQEQNPNSPDWEKKLIETIKKRTNLLEPADYQNILSLQKYRHLCAHPVIDQSYELYSPNKETTRAFIRNSLEGVLLKPPLLSRKIFADFLENISEIKHTLVNSDELEKHLTAKYLKNLPKKVESHIFRSLWKITFKVDNKEANRNRDVNLKVLKILCSRSYDSKIQAIKGEVDYYSDIDKKRIYHLLLFFNSFQGVFDILNDSLKIIVTKKIESDADYDALALFVTKDIPKHIEKIIQISSSSSWDSKYQFLEIQAQTITEIYHIAIQDGFEKEGKMLLINIFGNSDNYDTADTRFRNLIDPFLNTFDKIDLENIIKAINDNSQIYGRRKGRESNWKIKQQMNKISNNGFKYHKYPNFKNHCT